MDSDANRALEPCSTQCPPLIAETLALIGAKWTAPIFFALYNAAAPLRYAELQRRVGAITPKELAKHLKLLDVAGLVERRVHATMPPQVSYLLTELGRSLHPALEGLADWASRFGSTVALNREKSARPTEVRPIKPDHGRSD